MLTITLTRGIPSSGKSTLAAQIAAETGALLVCPEAIRDRLAGEPSGWQARQAALAAAQHSVRTTLAAGRSAIVDDCHIHDFEIQKWNSLAAESYAEVRIVEPRTPLAECLDRNCFSPRRLPEDVLRRMDFGMSCPLPPDTASLVVSAPLTEREEVAA